MEKKIRYPIEAFALAMVLFSTEMKTAMLVGIALIFGDVLSCFLQEAAQEKGFNKAVAAQAASLVMAGGILVMLQQKELSWQLALSVAAICAAQFKHACDNAETSEYSYGDVLFADSIAYGAMVLLAVIREYLAGAEIFGYNLPEAAVGASVFGKPMFALIGTGLAIALVNRVLKTASTADAALWVCLPVIVLEIPFVWNNVPELLGTVVGALMVAVLYVTLRKKLVFSETLPHIAGVPVELAMLGMMYMVVTIL